MSILVREFLLAGALMAESAPSEVAVRATASDAPPETVSMLSARVIAGLEDAGFEPSLGGPWPAGCADDACASEAMQSTSAAAVILLSVEQHDNVYAFVLEARAADGAVLGRVEDVCEICGEDEVAELVELRAGSMSELLESARLGTVHVVSEPIGAEVVIDGATVGFAPIAVELPPGTYAVQLRKPGFVDDRKSIEVVGGVDSRVGVTLLRQPNPSVRPRGWFIAGGVATGLGVAGLAAGIPLVLIDTDPYERNCRADPQGNCAKLYDTMGAGASLTTAGAIGVGAGTVMLLLGRRHRLQQAEIEAAPGGVAVRF